MPTRRTPIPIRAKCLICGTELDALVFDCPDCATPHHSACWQWSGGCAVYGCGRVARPVRESGPPARVAAPVVLTGGRRSWSAPASSEPPDPRPETAPADTVWMTMLGTLQGVAVILAVSMLLFLCLSRTAAASRGTSLRVASPVPTAPAKPPMVGLSETERRIDELVRDDDEWTGSGAEPGPRLRRMMVESRGEALRSGVARLAARPLPDWVRVRVQALQRLCCEQDLRFVLRRP